MSRPAGHSRLPPPFLSLPFSRSSLPSRIVSVRDSPRLRSAGGRHPGCAVPGRRHHAPRWERRSRGVCHPWLSLSVCPAESWPSPLSGAQPRLPPRRFWAARCPLAWTWGWPGALALPRSLSRASQAAVGRLLSCRSRLTQLLASDGC